MHRIDYGSNWECRPMAIDSTGTLALLIDGDNATPKIITGLLAEIGAEHLAELVVEAWRVQAPKYLVRAFDDQS